MREAFHRLQAAGKQVLLRPTLLFDAIRKLDLKALWVPDRKRILIDAQLPPAKHRWVDAHEVTHSLVPYHKLMLHGDRAKRFGDQNTPSWGGPVAWFGTMNADGRIIPASIVAECKAVSNEHR